MAPLILGYWNYRGYGAPIIKFLHHVGADFETKIYNYGDDPATAKDEWLQAKDKLGLDFPNVPYLIDGDVRISQTVAILRRLARKYGLAGKNENEFTQIDLVEQQVRDLHSGLGSLAYGPSYETMKEPYLQELPEKLRLISTYLGTREWFVGDSVTYVDFLAYEALDIHNLFAPELFSKFQNLNIFLKRVESLPKVNKYMNSNDYIKWPLFAKRAAFGGKGPCPE